MDEEQKRWIEERGKKALSRAESEEEKDATKLYTNAKAKTLSTNPLSAMEIVKKIDKGDKDFSNVRIVGVDWVGRDLSGYNFQNSILEWVRFSSCKLIGANFSNAHIDFAMFSNADLTKANFEHADIWDAEFDSAMLNDTSFRNANLRWVLFTGNTNAADFSGAVKLKIYTSWHDITEEDWNIVFDYVRRFGLSGSQMTFFKSQASKFKSYAEKIRFFYDFGREFMASSSNAYTGSSKATASKEYKSTDTYAWTDPYARKRTKSKDSIYK